MSSAALTGSVTANDSVACVMLRVINFCSCGDGMLYDWFHRGYRPAVLQEQSKSHELVDNGVKSGGKAVTYEA